MDNNKNKNIRLDPEKFGFPPQKKDIVGMISMVMNFYRKMLEGAPYYPLWLKMIVIVLALVVLCLTGTFYIFVSFLEFLEIVNEGLKVDVNSIQVFSSILLGLILGFIFLVVGIKIIYANIKNIRKQLNN
jgi:hypothetical protein